MLINFFTYYLCVAELASSTKVTEKCDVYSFAVAALEVLMGKHPQELLLSLQSGEYNLLLANIFDKRLTPPSGHIMQDLVLAATLALICISENPMSRHTMRQVSSELLTGACLPLSIPLHLPTLQNLIDMFSHIGSQQATSP